MRSSSECTALTIGVSIATLPFQLALLEWYRKSELSADRAGMLGTQDPRASLMTFLNQVRTAVAHRWDNDGEVMAPLDQFLDSVNVPPPALLPFLWAPVGLRYHALHHLMPRLPYHNLGAAHRRLTEALPDDHVYRQVEQPELFPALARLLSRMRLKR